MTAQRPPYLSVNLEPDITLGAAFNNRPDSHESDNQGLSGLNRDVHLLANIRAAKEVARRNDAVTRMSEAHFQ